MPVQALRLPDALLPAPTPMGVEQPLATLRERWASLRAAARRMRPDEGSVEEQELVRRVVHLSVETLEQVPDTLERAVRGATDSVMRDLLVGELAEASPERRLGFRYLQQAFDALSVLLECVVTAAPKQLWTSLAAGASAQEAAVRDDPQLAGFLRWELDLFVASDALDGPDEELLWWASRAAAGARRVRAALATGVMRRMLGALARVRARGSWGFWDEEEIQRELAPWPRPGE